MARAVESLPHLRVEISGAARILRMGRATLYERIRAGQIRPQKDGRRSYITMDELRRYVASRSTSGCVEADTDE